MTRYYSALAEVRGSELTKHYFAGGLRIAERVSPAPAHLAWAAEEPAAVLLLLAVPGRRQRQLGAIPVGRGRYHLDRLGSTVLVTCTSPVEQKVAPEALVSG